MVSNTNFDAHPDAFTSDELDTAATAASFCSSSVNGNAKREGGDVKANARKEQCPIVFVHRVVTAPPGNGC
jgi:hypothetical protein